MGRPGLSAHPKFRRLAVLLGDVTARGVLELLWESCYDALDDALGTREEIAYLLGLPDEDAVALIEAVLSCGFIDEVAAGVYRVHDLWDHCPDYVLKRCKASGERLSDRRSKARQLSIPCPCPSPSLENTKNTEQRAAREPQPVQNAVDGCAKPERPPSVLLRAGFAAREELADDASEVDLKEDLKRIVSQAHLPFDGQQINAALDVVTRLKPLKAELERHRRRQHVG